MRRKQKSRGRPAIEVPARVPARPRSVWCLMGRRIADIATDAGRWALSWRAISATCITDSACSCSAADRHSRERSRTAKHLPLPQTTRPVMLGP